MELIGLIAVILVLSIILPRRTIWEQPEVYVQSEALWEMLDYYQGLADHAQDEILAELTPYQRDEFEKMDARYRESGDIPSRMVTPQVIEAIEYIHRRLLALSMESHLVLFNALEVEIQNMVLEGMGEAALDFCALNNLWLDTGNLPLDQPQLWTSRRVRGAADEALARFYYETDALLPTMDIERAIARGLVFTGGYLPENPANSLKESIDESIGDDEGHNPWE